MVNRRSGVAMQGRQNHDVDEDDRGPPGPLRRTLLLHKKTIGYFLFKISAAPPRCSPDTRPARKSVYPENNREVLPKLLLGPERTMETNPSTHPRAIQKNMDNPKPIRSQIRKDPHTYDRISFGQETPN